MRILAVLALVAFAPAVSLAQSAGEVERCFQNPAGLQRWWRRWRRRRSRRQDLLQPVAAAVVAATRRPGRPRPAPDYTTVLQSPDPDRRKIQKSLRTLDKYNGPIDGNLQSDATVKAIQDWQKGRGTNPVGKLTPQEAQQLNAEAARTPIRRVDPSTQTAETAPATPTPLQPPAEIQRRCTEGPAGAPR